MERAFGLTIALLLTPPAQASNISSSVRSLRGAGTTQEGAQARGLCSVNSVALGAVTKKVCQDSAERCEAYIHKGYVNGRTVTTCADYCTAHSLQCLAQYDDNNDCGRGQQYTDCFQTGHLTSDHICVCGAAPAAPEESTTAAPARQPEGASGLCGRHGVSLDAVTRQVCQDSHDSCEVYMKKGEKGGAAVRSCRDYCGAYELGCKAQYEDESNGCARKWKYGSCDEPDDSTSDHICQCVAPSEASPTPAPTPPEPPMPQACKEAWHEHAGRPWEPFTCGDHIEWLKTQGFDILRARRMIAEQYKQECGACRPSCEEVWNVSAGGYTCGERIESLMYGTALYPLSEREAREYVSGSHPEECGVCKPGPTPAPTPAPTPKPPPPPPPAPGSPARLLTFNVWWKNRQYDAIADLIIDVNADIVNLQEAVPFGGDDKVERILAALNQRSPGTWAAANPWSREAYWCGLTVYRSDYWKEPKWSAALPVWQNSHVSKERGICGSLLERRVDDTRVCVWGGHPGWSHGGSPHWAMELVDKAKEQMKECAETFNAPSVFMCDCNSGNADAIKGQLEASTGADWDVAAHYSYDQIYVTASPPSGNLSATEAPAWAFGQVKHYSRGAVHEGACCAGQQDKPCWRNAPMCSEWAYSDHPPVHVDITLPLPHGRKGIQDGKETPAKKKPMKAGVKAPKSTP